MNPNMTQITEQSHRVTGWKTAVSASLIWGRRPVASANCPGLGRTGRMAVCSPPRRPRCGSRWLGGSCLRAVRRRRDGRASHVADFRRGSPLESLQRASRLRQAVQGVGVLPARHPRRAPTCKAARVADGQFRQRGRGELGQGFEPVCAPCFTTFDAMGTVVASFPTSATGHGLLTIREYRPESTNRVFFVLT